MIVPCPHCGKPIDVLELAFANSQAKEKVREKEQQEFDKVPIARGG